MSTLFILKIFLIHTFTEDAILYSSQNWIPALLPKQTWVCQGQNQSSRFLELIDDFGAYNSLSWSSPELLASDDSGSSLTLSDSVMR